MSWHSFEIFETKIYLADREIFVSSTIDYQISSRRSLIHSLFATTIK